MAAMENRPKLEGFAGLRVLSLESRRAPEMAKLIANYGGVPIVAASMREVPLESNTEALAFGRTVVSDGFDVVIFLTGVGTRALARVVETIYPVSQFVAALQKTAVVARGPKPVAALKEMGVPVVDDELFKQSLAVMTDRRRMLHALVKNEGWTWDAVWPKSES